MAKYLVETYYTCSFKVSHYLDNIDEESMKNIEKREDGKFEILDVKLDSRKTKNLEKIEKNKINAVDKDLTKHEPKGSTKINRIYHLDRGYEKIDKKLSSCGANIIRGR